MYLYLHCYIQYACTCVHVCTVHMQASTCTVYILYSNQQYTCHCMCESNILLVCLPITITVLFSVSVENMVHVVAAVCNSTVRIKDFHESSLINDVLCVCLYLLILLQLHSVGLLCIIQGQHYTRP